MNRLGDWIVTATFLLTAGVASAAERSWAVDGASLKVLAPCARMVTIEPGAAAGQVSVAALADDQAEIDRLKVEGGEIARISADPSCNNGVHLSRPSLTLAVRLPQGASIVISDGGVGDYRIGPVAGEAAVELAGTGNLRAEAVKDLTLTLTGTGNADVDQVEGKLAASLNGSGNLAIAHLKGEQTTISLRGNGNAAIADGQTGILSVEAPGAGSLTVPAAASAKIQTSGAGRVTLARLDGPLEAHLSGAGGLAIMQMTAPTVRLSVNGANKVLLGSGTVGNLNVLANGMTDVSVDAVVTDVTIELNGVGSVRLPHVTGKVTKSNHGLGQILVN